jgi:glycosyltransferase involved in cell wall biosynthesis
MNHPIVSVIIPVFNRATVVERAIASVYKQDFQNYEVLVVDDASTDETPSVLVQLQNKYPSLKILTNKTNAGVSAARNLAAEEARGEWLAFLDSDDEWLKTKLSSQLHLAREEGLPLVHSEEIWIRNGVRVNQKAIHQKGGGNQFYRSIELCCISPSAALLRRDYFFELGRFDESFEVCEDYDLWLRLTARTNISYVSTPQIIKYGGHEDQLSRKHHSMDFFRLRALMKLINNKNDPVLSPEQFSAVEENIRKRATILAQGMEKRGKQTELAALEAILKKIEYATISTRKI